MSRVKEFKMPDLGEGLTEGEILQWLVNVGDVVTINQPIVEVETAKAAVEIPSPQAGKVLSLAYEAGATVDVGAVIMAFDTDPTAGDLPVDAVDPKAAAQAAIQGELAGGEAPTEAMLVGPGPKATSSTRRARKGDAPAPSAPVVQAPTPPTAPAPVAAPPVAPAGSEGGVLAKPPVRKLAKDLGIDLSTIAGTGPQGSVTRADIEAAQNGGGAAVTSPAAAPGKRGETRIPIKGVRKLTAANMVASAFTAPHVTEFMTVDVTPTMELVKQLKAMPEFATAKVTPMLLVAKALLVAIARNPEVNATWDEPNQEIVVKHYVNLGIAAATPRGLLVPNIKNADELSLVELAVTLTELVNVARDGKTAPADMSQGTITITNVGTFGVDNGTPIINPGESAILCFGAVRDMPWVHEGEIKIRKVTQLSLSFDHRNVDGALGSQVLADIGNALADPMRLLAWS